MGLGEHIESRQIFIWPINRLFPRIYRRLVQQKLENACFYFLYLNIKN